MNESREKGRFLVGLAVAAVAALSACGGAEAETLSGAELAEEMNQICIDNSDAFDEIGHPETFDEIVAMTPQLIEVFDATLTKLDQLEAGPDDSDALSGFVTLGEQQRDLMGRLQTAAADGGAGFEDIIGEMGIVAEQSAELATQLGATECLG